MYIYIYIYIYIVRILDFRFVLREFSNSPKTNFCMSLHPYRTLVSEYHIREIVLGPACFQTKIQPS